MLRDNDAETSDDNSTHSSFVLISTDIDYDEVNPMPHHNHNNDNLDPNRNLNGTNAKQCFATLTENAQITTTAIDDRIRNVARNFGLQEPTTFGIVNKFDEVGDKKRLELLVMSRRNRRKRF